mmetsp:Transcript_6568/g.11886  ORF Transcript_6568/g.11886 Transcript_6568/m.11886 type:complete len:89 (+) Transcript_6568:121-387(+)
MATGPRSSNVVLTTFLFSDGLVVTIRTRDVIRFVWGYTSGLDTVAVEIRWEMGDPAIQDDTNAMLVVGVGIRKVIDGTENCQDPESVL